jgi:hypothetical protein
MIHRDDCPRRGSRLVDPLSSISPRRTADLRTSEAFIAAPVRLAALPRARRTTDSPGLHEARSSRENQYDQPGHGDRQAHAEYDEQPSRHGRHQAPHDLTDNDHKLVLSDAVSDSESPLAASARGTPFFASRGHEPPGLSASGQEDSPRCSSYAATAAASTYDPRSR